MPVHTDVSTICSILMLLAFPGTFSASQGKRGLYAGAYRCLYYMFHINAASIPWNIFCFTGEEVYMPVHTDVSTMCSILMLLAFPGTFSASQGQRGLYGGAYRCVYYMFHINVFAESQRSFASCEGVRAALAPPTGTCPHLCAAYQSYPSLGHRPGG